MNVSKSARKGFPYDIGGRLLTAEQDFCCRSKALNPFSYLYSIQPRQADIKQNQLGIQLFCLLDGFQPVRGFGHLKNSHLLEERAGEPAKRFKVIDYQYLRQLRQALLPNCRWEVGLRLGCWPQQAWTSAF